MKRMENMSVCTTKVGKETIITFYKIFRLKVGATVKIDTQYNSQTMSLPAQLAHSVEIYLGQPSKI